MFLSTYLWSTWGVHNSENRNIEQSKGAYVGLTCEFIILEIKTEIIVFPRIIARVIISFFTQKRGDYSREAIISNIAHWKSCPKFIIYIHLLFFH